MKQYTKRLLSMLLALAMLLSLVPAFGLGAAAADGEGGLDLAGQVDECQRDHSHADAEIPIAVPYEFLVLHGDSPLVGRLCAVRRCGRSGSERHPHLDHGP